MLNYADVDFFIGPYYALSTYASAIGESLQKLVLLPQFPADDVFNCADLHYTLSFTPPLSSFSTDCLQNAQDYLRSYGLTTNMTVFVAYTVASYYPGLEALKVIPTLGMNLVGNIYYDPTVMTWNEIASNISFYRTQAILVGGVGDLGSLLPPVRKLIALSKGAWNPIIATFDLPFPEICWYQEGLIYPQSWVSTLPTINNDTYFGTAADFAVDLAIAAAPTVPPYGEAAVAAAILTLHTLINITQSLDGNVLTTYAKSGAHLTNSFFGEIAFKGNSISRPNVCIQNQNKTYPIIGPDNQATGKLILNPDIIYPPHFFDVIHPDNTLRDALIGSLVTTFGVAVIVLALVLIILKKYHLIFIPKKDRF